MRAGRTVAAVCVSLAFLLLIGFVTIPNTASADSQMWTTDDDWRSGILDSNLVIQGTGAAASLQLRRSDFPDWMKMNPSTVPPARDSYCLAWIETDNSFLMFGGSGAGGDLGDTWKYQFATDAWRYALSPVWRGSLVWLGNHAYEDRRSRLPTRT